MRFVAFLLPFLAMFAVGGVFAAVELRADPGGVAISTPAPDTGPRTPQLRPGASVCQGMLHRRDPQAPAVFPDQYTQRWDVLGVPVLGGPGVSIEAFDAAEETILHMFEGSPLLGSLTAQGAYVVITEPGQGILDLPEFACLESEFGDGFFDHVCGVADRADYPVVTVNELDLVGGREGPCRGLNVLYHELGHLVQNWALDPPDWFDVKFLFQDALDAGKYRRQYAAENANEYFAEGTQAYFLHGEPNGGKDRKWLAQYDPNLFELLDRIYSR